MQINKTAYHKYYFSASLTEQEVEVSHKVCSEPGAFGKEPSSPFALPFPWLPEPCP